jgi:hypothetical protein
VNSIAFSPNGAWLASGAGDNTVKLWAMPGGAPLGTLNQPARVDSVSVNASSTRLAVACRDELREWDVPSQTLSIPAAPGRQYPLAEGRYRTLGGRGVSGGEGARRLPGRVTPSWHAEGDGRMPAGVAAAANRSCFLHRAKPAEPVLVFFRVCRRRSCHRRGSPRGSPTMTAETHGSGREASNTPSRIPPCRCWCRFGGARSVDINPSFGRRRHPSVYNSARSS